MIFLSLPQITILTVIWDKFNTIPFNRKVYQAPPLSSLVIKLTNSPDLTLCKPLTVAIPSPIDITVPKLFCNTLKGSKFKKLLFKVFLKRVKFFFFF